MSKPKSLLHLIVETSPNLAEPTRKKYLSDLDAWVTFAGADPVGWTRQKASDFYRNLLERMQPQSANRLMSSLRYASKWYATEANRSDLDFAIVRLAKDGAKAPRRSLSEASQAALLEACTQTGWRRRPMDMRDFGLVVVALETGMRRMSLCSMQVDGIQRDSGYPAIDVAIKGREDRVPIPLSDTALHALGPWMEWLRDQRITTGPLLRSLSKRIESVGLSWEAGPAISVRAVNQIIEQRGEVAQLTELHPHLLRHTFVTTRLEAKVSPFVIAAMTWHSLPGLQEMNTYMDRRVLGAEARTTTPSWLAEAVERTLAL